MDAIRGLEGKKMDRPSITSWTTRWPSDNSVIADCEIEVYFQALRSPIGSKSKAPIIKPR